MLVKGRRNYLSLRRLESALARSQSLFNDDEQLEQLRKIRGWSKTRTTARSAISRFSRSAQVWDEVASDSGNCMGRRCPTYSKCFYYKDRRRAQHAQILVVNHALLFSDLALRRAGVSILPDYDIVILDEAHTVEAVAGDHLGINVTSGQIEYVLNKLYNDRTQQGSAGPSRLQRRAAASRPLPPLRPIRSSPTSSTGIEPQRRRPKSELAGSRPSQPPGRANRRQPSQLRTRTPCRSGESRRQETQARKPNSKISSRPTTA